LAKITYLQNIPQLKGSKVCRKNQEDFMRDVFTKITIRIMPFLVLLYIVAFLDRVNIGFAALSMNRDIGISDAQFGLAAGMFFVGYFICEVPSNLLMVKFGARAWITRIMITWGMLSVAMVLVHSQASYVVLRFLLGAAEAGFFPGVIFYLTMWLPSSKRAGMMSLFVFSIPLANVIGGPISAAILKSASGWGLQGWQWLFLLEGIPAIVCGCLVPLFLPDSPWDATWLNREEKFIINRALLAEAASVHSEVKTPLKSFMTPFMAAAAMAYFSIMLGLYGVGFWLPRIFKSVGSTSASVGWKSAIPYGLGGLLAIGWAYHSDHTSERRWHLVSAATIAALGAALAASIHSKTGATLGFTLTSAGIFSTMPIFWTVTTKRITGITAAAAIAIINSIGNLGGFVGPSWMGWISERTKAFSAGLYSVAFSLLCGAAAMWFISSRESTIAPALVVTETSI
jgi:ACS family tartrate transporter-like MFS transporter